MLVKHFNQLICLTSIRTYVTSTERTDHIIAKVIKLLNCLFMNLFFAKFNAVVIGIIRPFDQVRFLCRWVNSIFLKHSIHKINLVFQMILSPLHIGDIFLQFYQPLLHFSFLHDINTTDQIKCFQQLVIVLDQMEQFLFYLIIFVVIHTLRTIQTHWNKILPVRNWGLNRVDK